MVNKGSCISGIAYSIAVDEITNCKQSVIQMDGNILPPCDPRIFTQWSADNVDHDVVTLDGSNTFHGMPLVEASSY